MSIGERIVALRTARKMSQSDLSEALDVSRQSISKWETDSSVPELDKLVALCEIFGVSMDMLVRGIGESEEHAESSAPAPETEPPRPEAETAPPREVIHVVKFETRKIAGILLFICAAVCVVTCTLLGDLVAGFLLALPFIICGIICCTCKKRAGLWCAWTVYLLTQVFIRVATGIHTYYLIAFFKGEMELTMNAIMAFAELMLTLLLIFFTVWSFRLRSCVCRMLRLWIVSARTSRTCVSVMSLKMYLIFLQVPSLRCSPVQLKQEEVFALSM